MNWLTFLGPGHVRTLGGRKALARAIRDLPAATMNATGRGVALRAGAAPRLIDSADGLALEPYRDVFSVIKDVLVFDLDYGRRAWPNDESHLAWLRRHARD